MHNPGCITPDLYCLPVRTSDVQERVFLAALALPSVMEVIEAERPI
jgi:hypothetical protein